MSRDKDNSTSETVYLDISGLRGTRKVMLRHLINSSLEAQKIIDSDSKHSQKNLMKISSLKTCINEKLRNDEKISNKLEQVYFFYVIKIFRSAC